MVELVGMCQEYRVHEEDIASGDLDGLHVRIDSVYTTTRPNGDQQSYYVVIPEVELGFDDWQKYGMAVSREGFQVHFWQVRAVPTAASHAKKSKKRTKPLKAKTEKKHKRHKVDDLSHATMFFVGKSVEQMQAEKAAKDKAAWEKHLNEMEDTWEKYFNEMEDNEAQTKAVNEKASSGKLLGMLADHMNVDQM